MAGAVFGLTVIGPFLGAAAGEVFRPIAWVTDWLIGSNLCIWAKMVVGRLFLQAFGIQALGGEKDWITISGSILGAVVMAVYGWVRGWHVTADRDGPMRLRSAIVGAAIPGPFLGVSIGVIVRGLAGLAAWPFGWDIGSWSDWTKWAAAVGVVIGWGLEADHFARRLGVAAQGIAIGVFIGAIVRCGVVGGSFSGVRVGRLGNPRLAGLDRLGGLSLPERRCDGGLE